MASEPVHCVQVFMADSSQYYEVIVEYKGTKTSGAPMAAAAAGWGTSNIYARWAMIKHAAACWRIAHTFSGLILSPVRSRFLLTESSLATDK